MEIHSMMKGHSTSGLVPCIADCEFQCKNRFSTAVQHEVVRRLHMSPLDHSAKNLKPQCGRTASFTNEESCHRMDMVNSMQQHSSSQTLGQDSVCV